jgi:hypothetical protein
MCTPGPQNPLEEATRNFFTNWRESDEPLPVKLALTLRNRFIATGLARGCCGHPGEPGC